MNDTIRDRLELLLAKIAGNDVDIKTMTPGVVTNLSEKFMIDIANRIDAIAQATGVDPSLSKLVDVDINSPSDGQALVYNEELGKWINEAIDDTYSLDAMTDVNIASLSDGQVLLYDGSTGKWQNSDKIKAVDSEIGSIESSLQWINTHIIESDGRITDVENRATALETQEAILASNLSQVTSDLSDTTNALRKAISNEASQFATTEGTTYNVGDYCIYENELYICTERTSSPEFDSAAWSRVNIGDKLKQNKNAIDSAASDATTALGTANEAKTAALSASTDASNALTAAASASSSAASAISTANTAASDAATAVSTASAAASDATTALNTANTANTRSQNAVKAIAATYNTSTTYSIGDYCTYNSSMYKCKEDNTTGAWDSSKWEKVTVGEELKLGVNVQSDWNESDTTSNAYIKNKPTIPTVNDATLTIQRNETNVGTFSANASSNATINIIVPTTASDVSALPSSTKYGASIAVSIDTTDYKITTTLKDQDGNTLGSAQVIDLPLESVVVNGSYDSVNKKIVLTLENGNTVDIPVGDLVAGLQSEITSENKLSSDLVDDTNSTNKFVTSAEKTKLSGIESGAEVNVQSDWNESTTTSDAYIKNKPSIPTNTSDLTNDSDFVSDASYVHTDNNFTSALKTKLDSVSSGAEVNVQSNWDETDTDSDAYILNKPTIPIVNNGKLTIQRNGSTVREFTANQSTDVTADITVPTKTSDITNDSNFVSDASYVHTDNNFTSTLKTKLNGIASGAEVNVQSDWNVTDNTSDAFIKNKPDIPTVNNAVLTIQKNGTTVNTFTANASSNVTANITVPTKTSDLTNDSGFITDISGKVSKSGDTMTGELQLDDTNARIKNATVAHAFSIDPASGGAVQLHYAASGNHGIYSKGYGSSLTDSSTFTDDTAWIIYRNASGYVLVSKWANTGNFLTPISFNEYGSPSVSKGQTIPYIVGTGTTAGTWTGTLTGLTAYYDGLLILYKSPVAGASTTTLNLNGLGAKTIYYSNTGKLTTHFPANQPILLVYAADLNDGCWECIDVYNSDTRPQAQCNTAAATAAKVADMTYFTATDKSYLMVNIRYANTSASKLTLNVNSTGAKDIYINGTVSSSTNYTLPAGSYLVYYSDSKYYFRTDGKITGDITGNAATVGGCTVATNVPSGAVFTDSKVTITNDTSTNGSFRVLLGTTRDDNTVTEGVKKSTSFLFNPSTGVFYTPREVINTTSTDIPLIIRTDNRSATPENGDDIAILNGAYKKNVNGTVSTAYNSIISLIGNNASAGVNAVRFGSSSGATIITGGANAKAFPKTFSKHNSDGAIWLAAQSEIHMYTNSTGSAASFGGHIWMNQGGLRVDRTDAAAGSVNNMYVIIGNQTSSSDAGSSNGLLRLCKGTNYANLDANTLSANRSLHLPDRDGTLMTERSLTASQIANGSTGAQSGAEPAMAVKADTLKTGIETVVNNMHQWSLYKTITCDGTKGEYQESIPSGTTGIWIHCECNSAVSASSGLIFDGKFNDNSYYSQMAYYDGSSIISGGFFDVYAYTIGNLWKIEYTDSVGLGMVLDYAGGTATALHTKMFGGIYRENLLSSSTPSMSSLIIRALTGNIASNSNFYIYTRS